MLYSVFILGDCFYRASFFARHWHVDDSVVRTALVTDTARDTNIVVDFGLSVRFEVDSVFRAVHITATSNATTAEVRDFVVSLNARRASFVHHAHDVLFSAFLASKSFFSIVREWSVFAHFVRHIEAEERESFVFPHCAFFVNTATATNFRLTWRELDRKFVDFFNEFVFFPKFYEFRQKTVANNHYVVSKSHNI
jgi:hypothetical protein